MNKEKMVLYLGYFALFLIGIYFTFGFLKISGEGLASLGYENNFIQEGFSDKDLDKKEKKIRKLLKNNEFLKTQISKNEEQIDAINDIPEYQEMLETYRNYCESTIKLHVQNQLIDGKLFSVPAEGKLVGFNTVLASGLKNLNEYTI